MARRTARRRRSRGFTPRRWLPFAALTALVVGAVMVSSEVPSKPPATIDPVLDTSRLPSVTASDAVATSWYCGGGTATGDGEAELSLLLANDDRRGAVAEITFLGAVGQEAATQVDVPAHGRARVQASEHLDADWVGAIVEVRGGRVGVDREVLGPLGFDAASCSAVASDHWFIPSGSTLRGANETLTLFNPFPDAASVSISFATDTGPRTPRSLRALSIPGRSVRTVDLGDIITNRSAIATTVRARSGRVVVDRVQTYDGTGDPLVSTAGTTDEGTTDEGATDEGTSDEETEVEDATPPSTNPPKGLVSTPAIPVRAPRWIFPGARVSAGVTTQVAVYNPGSQTAEIDVAISYQEPKRNPEIEPIALTIRPREQAVVTLDEVPGILPDQDLWVDVRSLDGVPVVAERLSFFGEPSLRTGAAASAGSPIAATRWMVPQGGATRSRSATVQVINPGDTSARVTVLTLSDGDRDELESASVSIPAGDRRSLDLGAAGAAATVIVASSKPVVVSSSLARVDGAGISVQPALPYPETVVALPPVS